MRQRLFSGVICLLLLSAVSFVHAQDDRLQIVASNSILANVATIVAGDAADVTSTMPAGADPHSFQPTPNELTALADADIVFVNGALFEEGLLEAIENAGTDMNIVTASSCVDILAFGEHDHDHEEEAGEHEDEHTVEPAEVDSDIAALCESHYAEMEALHEASHDEGEEPAETEDHEGEDAEHDHSAGESLGPLYMLNCESQDHEEEHEEGEHNHGTCDPHVWLDLHNVMYWTMLIRDTLIEADPANAETYTSNAAAYLDELDTLAHDFIVPMVESVPEENRILVTNHDAFGYFAAHYGFEVVGTVIPSGSTLAEPSTADVAALIDTIREANVPAIFAETTVNTSLADQIAEETGATIYTLYSGSLSDADGPASTYVDYIHYNITTIVEALGGGIE